MAAAPFDAVSAGWDRVTELFSEARALEGSARGTFLDDACAGDSALRQQIDALLAADLDDGFLEPMPREPGEALPESVSVLEIGRVLKDRYTIEERLGSGGQALVYRATDRVLSRPVVIKVMRAARPHHAMLRRRFEMEMQVLSRIEHQAVVGILDVGELDDGSPFLVIQFIDGVSVLELLRDGPLDPTRAARIIHAVGAGLGAAHAAGVAHRDLKPENIMVRRLGDGTDDVKLIDFGIAKIDRSHADAGTTVMIAGTVRYMAPEQFEGRHAPASDVYALGLVACELICGRPDVRALPATVGRRVRRLLEQAVAFEPEHRARDVKKWSEELSDALAARRGARRLMAAAAVAAAAIGVLMLGSARMLRESGGAERIIEKVGGFDPLAEGFQIHNALKGSIVQNPSHTGFDAWAVTSEYEGGSSYFRTLTAAQQKWAFERGWRLSGVLQVQEGLASVNVMFEGSRRFDINVLADADADLVRLVTQLVPTWHGQELRIPRTAPAYHVYELQYDPVLQTADLSVDGQTRLTGYRGHEQFSEGLGVAFGAAPYKSTRGAASFRSVRFEINP